MGHEVVEKESGKSTVRKIRRNTRNKNGAEEKVRIVLEGLRGESTIAELCRRGWIVQSMYLQMEQRIPGSRKTAPIEEHKVPSRQ